MIAFLSPAKNMQAGSLPVGKPLDATYPEETGRLLEILKTCQPWEFERMLKLNPELAFEAYARFQDLNLLKRGTPSVLAYKGLAYLHLNAQDFTSDDFDFAQDHLRIVSAFYGLLTPKTGIQPYRLEMRCKLRIDGKSLYRFWGDRLYKDLFATGQPVVNLASKEYSQAVTPFITPRDELITCDFLTFVRGKKLRTLPARAKMARGEMARFIVKNRLTEPEELKRFARNGFRFSEKFSSSRRYVFIQPGEE